MRRSTQTLKSLSSVVFLLASAGFSLAACKSETAPPVPTGGGSSGRGGDRDNAGRGGGEQDAGPDDMMNGGRSGSAGGGLAGINGGGAGGGAGMEMTDDPIVIPDSPANPWIAFTEINMS